MADSSVKSKEVEAMDQRRTPQDVGTGPCHETWWLQKGKPHRSKWEPAWTADQDANDEAEVAEKMARVDRKAGEEIAHVKTQEALQELVAVEQNYRDSQKEN